MREGGKKKHLGDKKNISPIGRPNKKNIGQISRKVNEGDEIETILTYFK